MFRRKVARAKRSTPLASTLRVTADPLRDNGTDCAMGSRTPDRKVLT